MSEFILIIWEILLVMEGYFLVLQSISSPKHDQIELLGKLDKWSLKIRQKMLIMLDKHWNTCIEGKTQQLSKKIYPQVELVDGSFLRHNKCKKFVCVHRYVNHWSHPWLEIHWFNYFCSGIFKCLVQYYDICFPGNSKRHCNILEFQV